MESLDVKIQNLGTELKKSYHCLVAIKKDFLAQNTTNLLKVFDVC